MYSKNSKNSEIQIRSDHIIPVEIETIVKTKEDQITVGKAGFVRVITMGKIIEINLIENENRIKFEIIDENSRKLGIEKILTTSFNKAAALDLKIDDLVVVAGKVRLDFEGKPFLNAFSIRKTIEDEFKAFQLEVQFSIDFYTNKSSETYMPCGSDSDMNAVKELNLGKLGLSRFPLGMLEQSSVTNNGNKWPEDLEIQIPQVEKEEKKSITITPDSFDSFEAQPEVMKSPVKEEEEEEEDSFDKY